MSQQLAMTDNDVAMAIVASPTILIMTRPQDGGWLSSPAYSHVARDDRNPYIRVGIPSELVGIIGRNHRTFITSK